MRWPFAVKTRLANLVESTSPSARFAFKVYRELLRKQEPANVFFSPASVMLCLHLLREGATGETQVAMDKVLEIAGLKANTFQSTAAALKSPLQVAGPGLKLEIANSIWCDQACTPRPEYLARVKKDYDAEVIVLDFGDPEAVSRINSWVSRKTRGKIGSIVDSLGPLAILVAINAIYFKGLWERQFERRLTREELFHTSAGRRVKIPLMSQYGSYPYYEESGFQAVRLGYKNCCLAMYVFLPTKTSSLQQFQENLRSAVWERWMERLETTEGQVRLPRFELTYRATLKETLVRLGMGIVFDRGRARFDTISPPPPPIWFDEVLHRAFVEVNEEGTEAAAVTATIAVGSAPTTGKRPRPFQMVVDRPFFFAIRDDRTGTIWFMGAVGEP